MNRTCASILAFVTVALIHGQTTASPSAQSPVPTNTVQIDAGFLRSFVRGAKNDSYYRVLFRGNPLQQAGTPIKYATHLDLAAPALNDGAGDTERFALRFEQGTLKGKGNVFDLFGAQELRLQGLERLRGVALFNSSEDFKKLAFAVGLETPPFRIPGFAGTEATNWIVFGVNAQRQENTDAQESSSDANQALITGRAFLGKAFGWHRSADVSKTAEGMARVLLNAAPTKASATPIVEEIRVQAVSARSNEQILLLDAYDEFEGPVEDAVGWAKTIRDLAQGEAEAKLDQPTFALYGEASGWFAFVGEDRLRGLLSVTGTYWLVPNRDDIFAQIRYELGYERSNPSLRKNNLIFSVGLRF